jgi:proline racemase/trans-L-3-hydroxyproline dehydratase
MLKLDRIENGFLERYPDRIITIDSHTQGEPTRLLIGGVVTEPVSPQGKFGLFCMDARRYPYLCGHATIGAVATLIEAGVLNAEGGETVITVDTPSGPLDAHDPFPKGFLI